MSTPQNPRDRVRALIRGPGDGRGIAVPLAHESAARIQERDWEDFTCDPTQLANGLRDLVDAVAPDGVVVAYPEILLASGPDLLGSEQYRAALEATRRLHASMAERVALVTILPDPATLPLGVSSLLDIGKEFLSVGTDVLIVHSAADAEADVGTLANIARFHQALALGIGAAYGLPLVNRVPLEQPARASGVVLTTEMVPRETDLSILEEWIDTVRE